MFRCKVKMKNEKNRAGRWTMDYEWKEKWQIGIMYIFGDLSGVGAKHS